ncbi:hypothetical protein Lser_V15G10205 [Lactuca serriola]
MGNRRGLGLHLIFISILLLATAYTCLGIGNMSCQRLLWNVVIMGCSDCCRWRRIQCDAVTGNVESLHLRGSYDKRKLYGNDLSSSLAELRHLKYLDLSENYFNLSKIPEFIGSLKQLRYLNLSNARVYGNVPPHIGNLSNLKVLDLSSNYGLVTNDVTWTFHLSSLEHLDLSLFDLSRTQNWDTLLYMLPSLKELYLSNCKLSKADIRPFLNSSRILPKIQHLDLSQNYFEGPLPGFLKNMTSLTFLDLSYSNISLASNFVYLLNMIPFLSELHLSCCGFNKKFLSSPWIFPSV